MNDRNSVGFGGLKTNVEALQLLLQDLVAFKLLDDLKNL